MAVSFNSGKPTRIEELRIKMELDGKRAHTRHAQAIKDIPLVKPIEGRVRDDDLLKIDYTLSIQYMGNVAKALTAVAELCADPDVVVSASCAELTQGRILCYEAFRRLDAVIREIEKR
jgi:hypothetical protein